MHALRSLLVWTAATAFGAVSGTVDLGGNAVDPFAAAAKVRVFVFVRTDCPVSNRYAPELKRLNDEFAARGAAFSLVYADPAQTSEGIRQHIEEYKFPGWRMERRLHGMKCGS